MGHMIHQNGCASITHTRVNSKELRIPQMCADRGLPLPPTDPQLLGRPTDAFNKSLATSLALTPFSVSRVENAQAQPPPPHFPPFIDLIWFSGAHHAFVHESKLIFMFKASKRSAESASYLFQHCVQVRD